jgi:hypothetical protein
MMASIDLNLLNELGLDKRTFFTPSILETPTILSSS